MTDLLAVRLRARTIAWPAGLPATAGWLAFVLATERWRTWGDGVRLLYASDIEDYETMARAAPGLPSVQVQAPHADRWVPAWAAGTIHAELGVGLHAAFALLTASAVALTIAAVYVAVRRATGDAPTVGLVVGALVASAYPVRYLLDAPGMLTDALFVLGLAGATLALVLADARLLVAALVVATLGRQTGVPVALVAAVVVLLDPRWRSHRIRTAALAAVLPVLAYLGPHLASSSFSDTSGRGLVAMTVGGSWTAHSTVSHVARCAIVLAVPAALLAVGVVRGRRPPSWGPLALGACVVVQALALAPDWSHAEPRLAGLALPALLVAAAPGLASARLTRREWTAVAVGIALASLHHLYAYPANRTAEWAALVVLGGFCCLVPLLGSRTVGYGTVDPVARTAQRAANSVTGTETSQVSSANGRHESSLGPGSG